MSAGYGIQEPDSMVVVLGSGGRGASGAAVAMMTGVGLLVVAFVGVFLGLLRAHR